MKATQAIEFIPTVYKANRKKFIVFTLRIALLFLAAAAVAPLLAQVDNGSITGIVHDASGSVIANAHVEVINAATNVKSEFKTNKDGTYEALGLIPGVYNVRATAPGFSTAVTESVRIDVQSIAKVDITLAVGDVKQEVQVSATAELLETQQADVGGVVESRQINELPLNGRNYDQLALLEPGVYADPSNEVSNAAEGRFSANGNLELQNYFSLDGIDNNTGSENLQEQSAQAVTPPPDALQEFRLQTRTYSTEFGTSAGAIVNASTKSGTNQFHGDVWEYLRNSALDANTFFDNYGGTPKGHFSQNQFGGTIGGPILRDHAFFFGAYQGLLSSEAQTVYSTVPTPAMKSGDFTALASQHNLQAVANGQAGCIVNNVVQPGCIDPVGQALINLYPDPNYPNVGAPFTGSTNYKYVTAAPNHTHTIDTRIDEKLNLKNQIFGRYSYDHLNYQSPLWTANPDVGNGDFSTQYILHDQSVALGWTYSPSSSLVNIAHFGFLRDFSQSDPIGLTLGQSDASKYGLTGIPITPETAGLPPIYIFGLTTEGSSIYRPQFQVGQVWQVIDDVYKLIGRHNLQFGYEYHENSLNFFDLEAPQGAILATGIYTNTPGFAPAEFLLGDIGWAIDETALEVNNYIRGNSFYAQDTWRATPKLTVNYGVRYELYPPFWLNRENRTSNFSPDNGGEIISAPLGGGTYGRVLIHPDNTDFAPRVGFAYHALPKVVLRGGFGIFHQFINRIGSESMLQLNPPFLRDDSVQQQLGSTTPVFQLKNGFPSAQLSSLGVDLPELQLRAQDPNERTSYVEQASFGPQIQLTNNTVLDAIWVGNWGRKMNRLRDANQGTVTGFSGTDPIVSFPYPNLNSVTQSVLGAGQHGFLELATNDGNTAYNGLELDLKRQLTHGLAYQVSYTYSHNLADYVDNLTGDALPQNAHDYEHEMSNSQQDVRHRLVGNAIWALPVGQGGLVLNENKLVGRLIGHWQANAIASFQTGIPFDVTAPDESFTGNNHQSYPDCTGDPFSGASKDPKDYVGFYAPGFFINPAAFSGPARGSFGDCRPRMFHGPGSKNVDLSVFKSFPIKDNWRFEFRTEFFNAFNHPNFANPAANTAAGGFGKSTATTNDPREIQFAAKIFF
jgi:Carboxypeptidase regulatory-like domain/TonB dependent receptor